MCGGLGGCLRRCRGVALARGRLRGRGSSPARGHFLARGRSLALGRLLARGRSRTCGRLLARGLTRACRRVLARGRSRARGRLLARGRSRARGRSHHTGGIDEGHVDRAHFQITLRSMSWKEPYTAVTRTSWTYSLLDVLAKAPA